MGASSSSTMGFAAAEAVAPELADSGAAGGCDQVGDDSATASSGPAASSSFAVDAIDIDEADDCAEAGVAAAAAGEDGQEAASKRKVYECSACGRPKKSCGCRVPPRDASASGARRTYKCSRCGQPKKGGCASYARRDDRPHVTVHLPPPPFPTHPPCTAPATPAPARCACKSSWGSGGASGNSTPLPSRPGDAGADGAAAAGVDGATAGTAARPAPGHFADFSWSVPLGDTSLERKRKVREPSPYLPISPL